LACHDTLANSLGFVSVSEIIGKGDYELPWKDNADDLIKNDNLVLEQKQSMSFYEEVSLSSGQAKKFLIKKVPLLNPDGSLLGTMGSSIDISGFHLVRSHTHFDKKKRRLYLGERFNNQYLIKKSFVC